MKWLVRRTACHFTRYKHVENTLQNPIKRNFRSAASVGTNETALETVSKRNEIGDRWPTGRGAFSSPISYVVQGAVSSPSSSSFVLSSAPAWPSTCRGVGERAAKAGQVAHPHVKWGMLSVLSKVSRRRSLCRVVSSQEYPRNRGQSQGGQRARAPFQVVLHFSFVAAAIQPSSQGRRADRRGSVRCSAGSCPPSTQPLADQIPRRKLSLKFSKIKRLRLTISFHSIQIQVRRPPWPSAIPRNPRSEPGLVHHSAFSPPFSSDLFE